MKRALGLIFVVVAALAAFLSVRGTLPFMPIFGTSMEPTFHTGGLLVIEPVKTELKVGDIIVFNVQPLVREHYNYPPVVAHRIININTDRGIPAYRTKGDNTGEDPFTIMPWDIRGTVSKEIPYIGFPLLFMQSKQGMIFAIVALVLLALFLYGSELGLMRRRVQRGVFAPVIEETYRTNKVLSHKIDVTEQRMDSTQQALEKFAAAIELYAQHLQSHTSAIQGLSAASQELSKSAAQQNEVLAHLMQAVEPAKGLKAPVVSDNAPAVPSIEQTLAELQKVTPPKSVKQYPPGCVRCRKDSDGPDPTVRNIPN